MNRICFLVLYFVCFSFQHIKAQSNHENTIDQMMSETEKKIAALENEYSTVSKVEFGKVEVSSPAITQVKLVENKTYDIHLFGEAAKIKDIDLKIYNSSLNYRTEETHEESMSNIIQTSFKPQKTGYYELEISADANAQSVKQWMYSLIISYY